MNRDTFDDRGVHWEEGLGCMWVIAKLEFDVDKAIERLEKAKDGNEKQKLRFLDNKNIGKTVPIG